MNCIKCNNIIPDGSTNCPYCGSPQATPANNGQQTTNPFSGLTIMIFFAIFIILSIIMFILMLPKNPSVGAFKTYLWLDTIRFASAILIPFGITKTGLKIASFFIIGIGVVFIILVKLKIFSFIH